jgi:hypothetical protein
MPRPLEPGLEKNDLVTGDIYSLTVPGGFTNVVFTREKPDLSGAWNQTSDLTYTPGLNLYTITGWGPSEGNWSTYS